MSENANHIVKDVSASRRELRIIIAGGGTGGHIFPAIAIANALRRIHSNAHIRFIGAKGKMEMEKVPQAGYEIDGLDIVGFNRSSLFKNITLPIKLVKSFLEVRRLLRIYRPHAVVGVGGYSSFPVLRYAQSMGIPTFIHESNSYAGRSNKLLGRKASGVFVASDGMEKFFPARKITITGNPVRYGILRARSIAKADALSAFGLREGRQTLLVIGGSLGARSINEAVAAGLEQLLSAQIQVIWQTGKADVDKWKQAANKNPLVHVSEFITSMENAYAAADIVISRAGAMAIAELCVVQKPVVFVPYPFATEDHQTVNAMHLVKKEAAVMVKDSEARQKLVPELLALAANPQKQEKLKKNIAAEAVTNADEQIAQKILEAIY